MPIGDVKLGMVERHVLTIDSPDTTVNSDTLIYLYNHVAT